MRVTGLKAGKSSPPKRISACHTKLASQVARTSVCHALNPFGDRGALTCWKAAVFHSVLLRQTKTITCLSFQHQGLDAELSVLGQFSLELSVDEKKGYAYTAANGIRYCQFSYNLQSEISHEHPQKCLKAAAFLSPSHRGL